MKDTTRVRCYKCIYFISVNDCQGDAPCSYHEARVLRNWFCSQFEPANKDIVEEIENGIKNTDGDSEYFRGVRNGMRWCLGILKHEDPIFEPAVQREQDAYDSGYISALKEVLTMTEEVAYEEDEFAEWTKTKSWHTVMRERVKALTEGKE